MLDYDYIIIGSGFGGSVAALRLAEKGYKVAVIEQGKRYQANDFPKTNWNFRKYFWVPKIGFYGSQVALPAFKEIAHNVYIKDGLKWDDGDLKRISSVNYSLKDLLNNYDNKFPLEYNNEYYPSVVGMHVRDAICFLENAGY